MTAAVKRFAEQTKVAPSKSMEELRALLRRYGATQISIAESDDLAGVVFVLEQRRIRISCCIPAGDQERRRVWRALILAVRARLEEWASEIMRFDEAFLAWIVDDSGQTVYERVKHDLALPATQRPELPARAALR